MKIKIIFFFLVLCGSMMSQNPRESVYDYAVLTPDHEFKPDVAGWANQRVQENLSRGLFAGNDNGKIYLSWRLLKTDNESTGFHIYGITKNGKSKKLNHHILINTTDFIVNQADGFDLFQLEVVQNGKTSGKTQPVSVLQEQFQRIPLQGDYTAYRMGTADLNGDGNYDYVILQPNKSIDPAFQPDTIGTTYKLEAYLHDGTFLYRIDLGLGIEPGTWYSPFVLFDFNGDGKAEIVAKTGPDKRDKNGRVTEGPEWFSVFDGMTGKEITKADWPVREATYGDYNRINRNQMGVAFLDGKTPAILIARGTYRKMVVDAWHLEGNKLKKVWQWNGDEENPVIRSQGAHSMITADVDDDGKDEIVIGSAVIDDNGTLLWSAGIGHPDKIYVTDVDPQNPGLEIFFAIEPMRKDGKGVSLYDAKSGKMIWSYGKKTWHVGDGMVADIDASKPGLECFALEDPKGGSSDRYMFSARGEKFGNPEDVPGCRNWLFWDADKLRETFVGDGYGSVKNIASDSGKGYGSALKDEVTVVKYTGEKLLDQVKGKVLMTADLFGDWREEIIMALPGELRIYTTRIPAKDRRTTLMQDDIYRAMIVHRSMGYMQAPVTGYYLGE